MLDMYQISIVRICGCLVLMIVQLCPLVREHSGTANRVWYWRSHRSLLFYLSCFALCLSY